MKKTTRTETREYEVNEKKNNEDIPIKPLWYWHKQLEQFHIFINEWRTTSGRIEENNKGDEEKS